MRLELLHNLMRIVDEREPSALASTVLSLEAEAGDLIFVGFVEFGEFLAELVLGDVGAVGMEDIALGIHISKVQVVASPLMQLVGDRAILTRPFAFDQEGNFE